MILSDTEVIDRISSPRNASNIQLARNQEDRLLLHGEAILEKLNLPFWAFRNFQLWWQSLITKEKHSKIEQLMTTPLATISLTEEIFMQISKFRDAQDRYVAFEFTNVDYTNDYQEYLQKINDDNFWRDICMDALRTGINDVVVIDLPAVQSTLRPEPYQYLVSPSMMVDLVINKFTGNIEYFIFKQSNFKWDSALNTSSISSRFQPDTDTEKLIAIDDKSYRIMVRPADDKNGKYEVLEVVPHDLGYCPCIDFWQPSIKGTNGINKKGILTNLYSKLDKYLFYSALVDYMDVYGAFPIFITYAMEDTEWDDKRKDVNFGDYYSEQTTSYLSSDPGNTAKDPRTSYTWLGAPGSVMEMEKPADASDVNFVKDSPKFINMPTDALKHVNDRCKTLRQEIIEYATGENGEYMNESAKNEEMLNASFNKQDSILTFVKRQVERVHRFCTKTRAELRYGKEYFVSCTVDYGSDYFLKDASKIVSEYKSAIEAGMSPEYCFQIAKEAATTRFKNNPDILARQRILRDVIPYQDLSLEDLIAAEVNISDVQNFVIRINGSTFISQFELDFGDIVQFGKTISYSDKIFFIKQKLKTYATGIDWRQPAPKLLKDA